MSAEKKQRGSRFTQAMSDALVESYAKYQYILQTKFSSTITNEKKKEAWSQVTNAVNAVNPGERKTIDQVKRRWEDLSSNVKRKERQARQKELQRLRVTGNGHLADEGDDNTCDLSEPCTELLTPSEQEIAKILGPQIFTGIPGGQDTMKLASPASTKTIDHHEVIASSCEDTVEVLQENDATASCSSNNTNTAAVVIKDSPKSWKECRKRPKTLAEAQLEYFETVSAYYKLKTRKVEMEMEILQSQMSYGSSQAAHSDVPETSFTYL